MVDEMVRIKSKIPRILPSGYKDFDDYFKILSGTCTIFYVCNQTYWDTVGLFSLWATNLFENEFSITISTRFDFVTVAYMVFERMPDVLKRGSDITKEERAYWIDMCIGKGLYGELKEETMEKYREKLKTFEIDPCTLYVVKNPEKRSSIDEVNSFIEEITSRVSKDMMGRIIIANGDDLVDAWGMGKYLEFYQNQADLIIHKFHYTGICLFSYNSYPKKFHSRIERMADNIVLWCYDEEKEEKYMQIIKSPIIGSFFGKVPYKINEKNLPEFESP